MADSRACVGVLAKRPAVSFQRTLAHVYATCVGRWITSPEHAFTVHTTQTMPSADAVVYRKISFYFFLMEFGICSFLFCCLPSRLISPFAQHKGFFGCASLELVEGGLHAQQFFRYLYYGKC